MQSCILVGNETQLFSGNKPYSVRQDDDLPMGFAILLQQENQCAAWRTIRSLRSSHGLTGDLAMGSAHRTLNSLHGAHYSNVFSSQNSLPVVPPRLLAMTWLPGHLKHQLFSLLMVACLERQVGFSNTKVLLPSSHSWMLLWKYPRSPPTRSPKPKAWLLSPSSMDH